MEEFRKRREELVLRDAAMALIEKEMNAKSEL